MSLIRKNDFQKERTNIIFQKMMAVPSSVTTLFQKRGPQENYSSFDMSHKQAQNLIDSMDVFVLGSVASFLIQNYENLEKTSFLPENILEISNFIVDNNILPALCALSVRFIVNQASQHETMGTYISNIKHNDVIDQKYNINNFKSFNFAYSISYILDTIDSIPNAPVLSDDEDETASTKDVTNWLLKMKESIDESLTSVFNKKSYSNAKIEMLFLPQTAMNKGKEYINKLLGKKIFDHQFNSKIEFLKSKEKVEKFIKLNRETFIQDSSLNRRNFDYVKRDIMKSVDEIYRVSYEKFIEQNIKMSFAYELSQYIKLGRPNDLSMIKKFSKLGEKAHHSYDENNKFKPYDAVSNFAKQILEAHEKDEVHVLYSKIGNSYKEKTNNHEMLTDKVAFDLTINYLESNNILKLHTFNQILETQISHHQKLLDTKRRIMKSSKMKM